MSGLEGSSTPFDLFAEAARDWVRRLLGALWPKIGLPTGMAMLCHRGFNPRAVFDIGVGAGTPRLYQSFPEAHFILVDPARESRPYMERIARTLDAEIWNVALGDQNTEMEIEARPDDVNGASFFKEIGPLSAVRIYRVPVRRFDSLFPKFERPTLCKIDVQGAELMVLKGMGEKIREIDVLIVEVSTITTSRGGPEAFEVLSFLKQAGFVMFDLIGATRRPLDNALAHLDFVFVPENSSWRADRRWSAGN